MACFNLYKKILITSIAIVLSVNLMVGQNKYPAFKTKNIELRFTKNLTGCMNDPSHTVEDEFIYNLKGQIFESTKGNIQTTKEGFNGTSNGSTPWKTLTELFAAYQSKDVDKIVALYEGESSKKIKEVLEGPDGTTVLEAFSKVSELKVLMGFEYKEGYLAVVEGKEIGVQINYFIKENNQYKLSQLQDKSPMSWNIALYWKYLPVKLQAPELQTEMDSLAFDQSKTLVFKLNKPGNWVSIFKEKVGEPTLFFLQDGGENDRNKTAGEIEIIMKGASLIAQGKYKLFVVESNYPIRSVSKEMIDKAMSFEFKVYK